MTLAQDYNHYGLSPDPEDNTLSSMMFDEDNKTGLIDDDLIEQVKPVKKGSSRKGPGMADKRAVHNAIERQRRETLNGRFMTLAEALPSMAKVKRPSKSAIVNKALDFVFEAQVKEHALIKENNDLRREVDQLRRQLGIAPLPKPQPLPTNSNDRIKTPTGNRKSSVASIPELPSLDAQIDTNGSAVSPSSSFTHTPQSNSLPSPTSLSYHAVFPNNGESPTGSSLSSGEESFLSSSGSRHGSSINQQAAAAAAMAISGQQQNPFGMHLTQQAMMQAQFGFMNPSLLTQQHNMMLAAQMHQQQQQLSQPGGFMDYGMMGWGNNGMLSQSQEPTFQSFQ